MHDRRRAVTVVIYACDFSIKDGELVLGDETKARLAAGQRIAKHFPEAYIVVPAGMSPDSSHTGTMAQAMQRHLLFFRRMSSRFIIMGERRDVWSSDTETKEAIHLIQHHCLSSLVVVVSSWYHIPRLWLLWKYNLPRDGRVWNIVFSGCRAPLSCMPLREIINIVGTLCGIRTNPFRNRPSDRDGRLQ